MILIGTGSVEKVMCPLSFAHQNISLVFEVLTKVIFLMLILSFDHQDDKPPLEKCVLG